MRKFKSTIGKSLRRNRPQKNQLHQRVGFQVTQNLLFAVTLQKSLMSITKLSQFPKKEDPFFLLQLGIKEKIRMKSLK